MAKTLNNETETVTVHVGGWYRMRKGRYATSRIRDYTVYHADGRRHIRVQSKAEVTRLVRKHYGKVAIDFVEESA